MPVTDPISDLLNRVRNANTAKKEQTDIPYSRLKEQIAKVLKKEGFIKDCQTIVLDEKKNPSKKTAKKRRITNLRITLKYGAGKGKILTDLKRVSKPGLRVYVRNEEIPRLFGGLGVVILSTSRGILTGEEARKEKMGGEVLCYVW
jgi:small subunit ribosomal protein S8